MYFSHRSYVHLPSYRNGLVSFIVEPCGLLVSCLFRMRLPVCSGSGSSVGIVTDYGLDGPGSNPGEDEIFRQSRPALAPTQPPVKWVPGLSRGKVRPRRAVDRSPPSSAAVKEE